MICFTSEDNRYGIFTWYKPFLHIFTQCPLICNSRIKKFHNNYIIKHCQGDKSILEECQARTAFFHTPLLLLNILHIVMYFVLIIVYLFSLYKYLYSFARWCQYCGCFSGSFVRMMDDSFIHQDNSKHIFPYMDYSLFLTITVFEFFFVVGLPLLLKYKQKFWHWPDAIFHLIKFKGVN